MDTILHKFGKCFFYLLEEEESSTEAQSLIKEEETSLLLSMVDQNILQHIFIQLVDQYEYCIYNEEEIKFAFTSLLNFPLTCKLFSNISNQPLFPLILNNMKKNLKHTKYFQILFVMQQIETLDYYKEKDINSIFYYSCGRGFNEILKPLLNYGANINHAQDENWTPLMIATIAGNIRVAKKLTKIETLNVNQEGRHGKTSLIWAAHYKQENIVNILLSRKDIDFNLKDNEGKTALDHAKDKHNKNIAKILQNHHQEKKL